MFEILEMLGYLPEFNKEINLNFTVAKAINIVIENLKYITRPSNVAIEFLFI
jgi:hypothetical protein